MAVPVLDDKDFAALEASATIRKHLGWITPDHRSACGCYLLMLPAWLFAAFYGSYALDRAGLYPGPWLSGALLAVALALPLWPLLRARRHMRRPVLDQLATQAGMDYASDDFEMKSFEPVLPQLFGAQAAGVFTDLIAGKEGGNSFAICRAEIEARSEPLYDGLLYWFGRRGKSAVTLSVVPRAVAGRAKLPGKARALAGIGDAPFDAAFAVITAQPDAAIALLKPQIRKLLLELSAQGPVYFYIGQNNAFVAGGRPQSFETDEEAARGRRERLRAIFDNVAAALRTAAAFRAQLD